MKKQQPKKKNKKNENEQSKHQQYSRSIEALFFVLVQNKNCVLLLAVAKYAVAATTAGGILIEHFYEFMHIKFVRSGKENARKWDREIE